MFSLSSSTLSAPIPPLDASILEALTDVFAKFVVDGVKFVSSISNVIPVILLILPAATLSCAPPPY